MNVLAVGQLTGHDLTPHIPAEQAAVAALREQGLIRDLFIKADHTGPILLLNDVDAAEAAERLSSLPFLTEGLLTFEYVELVTLAELEDSRASRPARGRAVAAHERLTGTYVADPVHSSFGFTVRAMGVSTFRGTLGMAAATLTIGEDGARLSGSAEAESISIREPEQFRTHVLSNEFLDATHHPQITFESERVVLNADQTAAVSGQLTIRGVTRSFAAHGVWTAPQADPMGKQRSHLALRGTINRRDYGMEWDVRLPDGAPALEDELTINVELALVAQ
jgi:polyisoprenoid-binding protein YceI